MKHLLYVFSDKPSQPKEAPTVSDITDNSASLTWKTPDSNGGAPILNYIMQYKAPESSHWKTLTVPAKECKCIVKDLMKDLEYVFKVAAENAAGIGTFSPESKPVLITSNK